jgi:hypothetical protein
MTAGLQETVSRSVKDMARAQVLTAVPLHAPGKSDHLSLARMSNSDLQEAVLGDFEGERRAIAQRKLLSTRH